MLCILLSDALSTGHIGGNVQIAQLCQQRLHGTFLNSKDCCIRALDPCSIALRIF